jgi:hypothetical protein
VKVCMYCLQRPALTGWEECSACFDHLTELENTGYERYASQLENRALINRWLRTRKPS